MHLRASSKPLFALLVFFPEQSRTEVGELKHAIFILDEQVIAFKDIKANLIYYYSSHEATTPPFLTLVCNAYNISYDTRPLPFITQLQK